MKKTALQIYFRLATPFIFITLLAFIYASEVSAKTYAYIVADARDGKILKSHNSRQIIHPASLTKMMTLYLAFDAIRYGRLKLDQKAIISKNAASEPPSKFWYKPGQRISIRNLIRASAVRSANDAATALGEAISGSEKKFVNDMNIAAKKMGMNSTRFKNAHGLTEIGHYSTAKDMLLLSRRLMLDYPEYFNIFSRLETTASGKTIRNTNYKFLRQYRGASGIKTGYTNAAGHNLAGSAKRGDKQLIGILIGTSSSSQRAKKIMELFDDAFKIIPMRKNISRLDPINLVSTTRIVAVTIPLSKPKSLEAMLESQRKGKENFHQKRANKILTDHMEINNVNVQIGMYTNFISAEKDMPNILLLNIELLTGIENSSIKIRKNKEKKYSIFVSEITYPLAENLCVRTRSQKTACNILKN
ncbi:MAG: D-alanyl-D-alanine carboxypeptidase family protein [Paracoccaceae bacterium]